MPESIFWVNSNHDFEKSISNFSKYLEFQQAQPMIIQAHNWKQQSPAHILLITQITYAL